MSVIEVYELTKNYGFGRGIFDVTFQVEQGEVFGFLGPNGAGKTTTIRHLLGFSNPQSGDAMINGMVCNQHAGKILKSVGYLPGEIALPEGLTGWEFIRMMQGLRRSKNDNRLKYLLDGFGLDATEKTKRMSVGEKRKLAIITAFMSDPDVLILDEPTSGLDPIMQDNFIQFLREEKKRGKTILLSSHMFSEVEAICDRISIIKEGRLVSTIQVDDIRHNESKTYQVVFNSELDLSSFLLETNLDAEKINSKVAQVNVNDTKINELIRNLDGYRINSFREIKYTLEDYFMHFYAKDDFGGSIHI
ncbi:ABC transporter ATP-binding protein [Paenibacillus illinoisensis]|uniref:ABC transporter ATP-binding protein n=1 Tax=Paenibacillus illinoisensis TaxID=59845 RepID=UPI001C8EAA37|nr:ABC transporter ATP-binding protein [Paenibacillus illinoisensis]MBY0217799.1 ABC transporter ATP-binding protein [Paenibacillus illinoisensis]